MAKRRNVSGRVLRNAVPQPRDVAEFVAPRTVNEGLSVKNVFGDVGDMVDPFITAAIEKQEGLRDVSDEELKMLAALGSIPVAGAVAGKMTKAINKMVPNPKGGFANAIFLRKSNKPVLVKPKTLKEYERFCAAINEGIKKGEISPADGYKIKQNAFAAIDEDVAYNKRPNYKGHTEPETIIPRSDIMTRDLPLYDAASEAGKRIGKNIEPPDNFTSINGNKFYLDGDQGKLLWNEHYLDDNSVRHSSNYQDLSDNEMMMLTRKFPGYQPGKVMPITINGRRTQVYDVAAKPQITNAMGTKLGYNYRASINKPVSEGRAATLRDPKYKSVDDFYRIMLGLEE